MARKINEKLIDRMTSGDLAPLLNYLKSEVRKLRLEVRLNGKAYIYYKKCKVLDLGLMSYNIDDKYFEKNCKPINIKDKVINCPSQYFKETLSIVDKWLEKHRKSEFETQQYIAFHNQEIKDKYIILDMEYNFSQSGIEEGIRVKQAGFDLLGIERLTGNIVFFEVKKGLGALPGTSGIKEHIVDFEECLYGRHKEIFRKNLITDIKNIVHDKKKLELLDNFELPASFSLDDISLKFVFESDYSDKAAYLKIFEKEYQASKSNRHYETIYLTDNCYKLL